MKKESIGITFHQLKIFWTVSQAASFTKASKILGLAQNKHVFNRCWIFSSA